MNMENMIKSKIETSMPLQILHAQGGKELTTVTQRAGGRAGAILPTHCLSQFKFQDEPH